MVQNIHIWCLRWYFDHVICGSPFWGFTEAKISSRMYTTSHVNMMTVFYIYYMQTPLASGSRTLILAAERVSPTIQIQVMPTLTGISHGWGTDRPRAVAANLVNAC